MTALDAPEPANPTELPAEKTVLVAGQWRLFWWKFKRHRLALASLVVVVCLYLVALTAEFLAPFAPDQSNARYTYAPRQPIHLFQATESGGWRFAPHVEGFTVKLDPVAVRRTFVPDPTKPIQIGFLVPSEPYRLAGLVPLSTKLVGPLDTSQPMYLLGADRLGRDILSRVIHGARISLSIGLVGVGISLFLGILLGGISGHFGGLTDTLIQRLIEFLRSIPTIPLWMGLAAAVPLTWPPLRTYFVITLIVSLIGWTSLAREVRGKFLSLRNEDFVTAARLDGMSEIGIIFHHLVPSFLSHIIATMTLAIPAMILAETSLSFLGIGLQPPIVSWGVLLQEAQNVRAVSQAPWLLFVPGTAVVLSVLALNFLGDGLRDAADPYAR
ncbi:ABC transporter permease [Prosthecomicrobium sp. N25]|uniref:ABC transporter permease n=1 Tax=Prosthecomicrobium sp. N25 TaxID=3129254 RepID=UPI003076FF7B